MHMEFLAPSLALIAATAIFIGLHRVKVMAQPRRLRLAAVGRAVLQREDLPPAARKRAWFFMNHAFGFRIYMVALVLSGPFIGWSIVARSTERRIRMDRDLELTSPKTRELWAEFDELAGSIMMFNHPMLVTLAMIEFVIIIGVSRLLRLTPSKALTARTSEQPAIASDTVQAPEARVIVEKAVGVIYGKVDDLVEHRRALIAA